MTLQEQLSQSSRDNLNLAKSESPKNTDPRRASVAAVLLLAVLAVAGCSMDNVTGPDPVAPAPAPQPSAGQPDLMISSTSFLPSSPRPGDEITFQVRVRNAGAAPAGASGMRFGIEGLPNLSEASVPALGPGEEYLYERKITLQVAQNYTARAEADVLAQIAESDEGNNLYTRSFSVTEAPGKPDLLVADISYYPLYLPPGETITFRVNVRNAGNAQAGASTLRIDVGMGCGLIDTPIPGLGPGEEYQHELVATAGSPQVYTIKAEADALSQLNESDESNNLHDQDYTVVFPLGKVDLVLTKLNFSPGSPHAGQEITFWVVVKNEADVGYSDPTVLHFKVGGSSPTAVPVPVLAPGEEFLYEHKVTLNIPQTYMATATADALGQQLEMYEDNNVLQKTFTVTQ